MMTRVLDLRPGGRCRVPADGPVRWEALDALPQLLTVEWAGPDRGIVAAIAVRPHIKFLYWTDAEGDVDLTRTYLGNVRIDGPRLRCVRLPKFVTVLWLGRPPAEFDSIPPTATISDTLQVDAPDAGLGLDLRLFHFSADVVIPDGLRRSSRLWLWVGGEVSTAVLANLTDLQTLRLTFDRPPGEIHDLAGLGRHGALHRLELGNAYGLAVDEVPDLPSLREFELDGTRLATARAVKSLYQGSAVAVSTSGAKTDTWVHDARTFGRAAGKAYNHAKQAADAIAADDTDRLAAAERVLRGLVADLNTINAKHKMIDTLRRDQAADAYLALAHELGVPKAQAGDWFDDDRHF